MPEEILPNLYRIEVPLPKNPLKSLNSYVIKGDGRWLIVDTGMNRKECLDAMLRGLDELSVDLSAADFFITHLHADHLGLVAALTRPGSRVYFNQADAQVVHQAQTADTGEYWRDLGRYYELHGFPSDEFERSVKTHPGIKYGLKEEVPYTFVHEGDPIEVGDYSFVCVETPGHSPGHMCLYEAGRKILVAGDHILLDITPNITFWPSLHNSLKAYLLSLEKVGRLGIELVLPGHRSIWRDARTRVQELVAHHNARAEEIVLAVKNGDSNAYQVVQHITWDLDCDSWDAFPSAQKHFAFGETLAHLDYLEDDGRVTGQLENGRIVYSVC